MLPSLFFITLRVRLTARTLVRHMGRHVQWVASFRSSPFFIVGVLALPAAGRARFASYAEVRDILAALAEVLPRRSEGRRSSGTRSRVAGVDCAITIATSGSVSNAATKTPSSIG